MIVWKRSLFWVLILSLIAGGFAAWPSAQAAPVGEEPAPQENVESLWIPGSGFHIRDGSIAYGSQDSGCVYAKSSADFSAGVQLPDGATFLGAEYFYYDAADQADSRIEISDFPLNPAYTIARPILIINSAGSAAYSSTYKPVTTTATIMAPYSVNNRDQSIVIDWYPEVFDATMQLCGVRIDYRPSAEPPALDTMYYRVAGSAFHARDDNTDYGYLGGGCTYIRSAAGALTVDVNLPENAALTGMQVYMRDRSEQSALTVSLNEYNGLGMHQTLAAITSTDAMTTYTGVYTDITTLPYTVNENLHALALEVQLTGVPTFTLEFCGVRLSYSVPDPATQLAGPYARFIAGSTFIAGDNGQNWQSTDDGCIYGSNVVDQFVAPVLLPKDARVRSVTHYYRDTSGANSVLNLEQYQGTADATTLLQVPSAGTSGFGSSTVAFEETYYAEIDRYGLALSWTPTEAGAALSFCGAKVTYYLKPPAALYLPVLLR